MGNTATNAANQGLVPCVPCGDTCLPAAHSVHGAAEQSPAVQAWIPDENDKVPQAVGVAIVDQQKKEPGSAKHPLHMSDDDHVDEMVLYMENCGISSESAKAYAEILRDSGMQYVEDLQSASYQNLVDAGVRKSDARILLQHAEIEAPKKNDTREQADLKRARRELTNLLDGFQIPDEAVKQYVEGMLRRNLRQSDLAGMTVPNFIEIGMKKGHARLLYGGLHP